MEINTSTHTSTSQKNQTSVTPVASTGGDITPTLPFGQRRLQSSTAPNTTPSRVPTSSGKRPPKLKRHSTQSSKGAKRIKQTTKSSSKPSPTTSPYYDVPQALDISSIVYIPPCVFCRHGSILGPSPYHQWIGHTSHVGQRPFKQWNEGIAYTPNHFGSPVPRCWAKLP